jgi:CP family cyanate transporter-like MFS transporter
MRAGDRTGVLGRLALLWLSGISLRVTILSVPPLLPTIHRALHLDETAVGALTTLPVLLLAVAAIPGSLLIAYLGARRALVSGLVLIAAAGAARGLGASAVVLFALTFVMGMGVAVCQPALPSLVRQWLPSRASLATAAYSNGLLVGEIVAAALTVPLLLSLIGGSWEVGLALWSLPVVATAAAVLLTTGHTGRAEGEPRHAWWPDWRSGLTWKLGLVLGGASAAYFGTNTFIPDYLRATHHAALITAALTSVNLCQLPVSFVVAAFPTWIVGRRWPIVAAGIITAASAAGFLAGGTWVVLCAGTLGFSTAGVFVLLLTLPPMLAGAHDVHRLSAAMFTLSYACAFLGSIAGGALWDATGSPITAFAPVSLAGIGMILLVLSLRFPAHVRAGLPVEQFAE